MWKDVSPRTSPCEALKAHLPDRFMDRLKKSVSKMTTTSFLRDLIGWDINIRMRWFFFSKANFTFFAFPVSSKCNRAKGCASSPMDVTSVVALQFREARPVSVISLWEAWSLEAKPSESSCFEKNTTWKQFTYAIVFSGWVTPWSGLCRSDL